MFGKQKLKKVTALILLVSLLFSLSAFPASALNAGEYFLPNLLQPTPIRHTKSGRMPLFSTRERYFRDILEIFYQKQGNNK